LAEKNRWNRGNCQNRYGVITGDDRGASRGVSLTEPRAKGRLHRIDVSEHRALGGGGGGVGWGVSREGGGGGWGKKTDSSRFHVSKIRLSENGGNSKVNREKKELQSGMKGLMIVQAHGRPERIEGTVGGQKEKGLHS